MMSSGRSTVYLKGAVVLVFLAAVVLLRLASAQHGMGGEGGMGSGEGEMGSGQRAAIARELAQSVHAELTCASCHGEMEMIGRVDPVTTCARCHTPEMAAYSASVHAVAFRRGAAHAPSCVTCHGNHAVKAVADPASPVSRLRVTEVTCARCHESASITTQHELWAGVVPDYRRSFHGLAAAQGDARVANCASCHSSHEIRPSRDPLSTTNEAKLYQTCGACHIGTTPGFARGGVHHDPAKPGHSLVDYATWFYIITMTLTIGFMLAHNALDFWGRLRDRLWRRGDGATRAAFDEQAEAQPLPSEGDVIAAVEPETSRRRESNERPLPLRFTVNERVQHWTLAASFILLAATGFALKYNWRIPFLAAQQGAVARGFLHRSAAVVFITLAIYHVGYTLLTRRGRANLRAMMPRVRSVKDVMLSCAACFRIGPPSRADWQDLIQTVKYNLGLVPTPPAMGRFTYAEKMEYFALLWGASVMILTGLMLWFEVPFLNRFPYWAIELATTVHFYEAMLATLAILVWHFYYTIFNPSVFPLSKAMITGRLGREEMEREHAAELRALESGDTMEETTSERQESSEGEESQEKPDSER